MATKKNAPAEETPVVDFTGSPTEEPEEIPLDFGEDLDFDSWTEEDEEAAILELAEALKVKCILIEKRIVAGKFPLTGEVIRMPLNVSLSDMDEIVSEADNQIDQVKLLLRKMGDETQARRLERQNLASTIDFAEKYFNFFFRIVGASEGK